GWRLLSKDKSELNLIKFKKLKDKIKKYKPNIIINSGAFTNVDKCENYIGNAYKVNSYAMKNLSQLCNEKKIFLIHISTDSVFNSQKDCFLDERSLVNPCNIYSKSKYLGEVFVKKSLNKYIILRVSWSFDNSKNNFVAKIIEQVNNNEIKVTSTEIGAPTPVESISNTILKIIFMSCNRKTNLYFGTFHFAGYPIISRCAFAEKILKLYGSNKNITGFEGSYNSTRRPNKTMLSCKKIERIYKIKQPPWIKFLTKSIKELKKCQNLEKV
ncbi:SDR family oxidoreductase, partial [Alphaproteobacteria bacterium]|nr:SDR family oxidoreductase [Alphaproteobacteria bacterium]